ncbi:MAG: hypothetical protein Q4C87_07915 [Actinomycetaceae bacterium]|nr:hypothetical protein [Actinomycetaceae bacterium]
MSVEIQSPADIPSQLAGSIRSWCRKWWLVFAALIVGVVTFILYVAFTPPYPSELFVDGDHGTELVQPVRSYLVPEGFNALFLTSCGAFTFALMYLLVKMVDSFQKKVAVVILSAIMGGFFACWINFVATIAGPGSFSRSGDNVCASSGFFEADYAHFEVDGIWMTPTIEGCTEYR